MTGKIDPAPCALFGTVHYYYFPHRAFPADNFIDEFYFAGWSGDGNVWYFRAHRRFGTGT